MALSTRLPVAEPCISDLWGGDGRSGGAWGRLGMAMLDNTATGLERLDSNTIFLASSLNSKQNLAHELTFN